MENTKYTQAEEKAAEEKISSAKYILLRVFPYFGKTLYQMQMIASDRCPTMGVDKNWRMYFNPVFTNTLTHSQCMGILYHELSHLLRRHCERVNLRHPVVWNYAADMEINDDIFRTKVMWSEKNREIEFETLKDEEGRERLVFPEMDPYKFPKDLSAEEYYERLVEEIYDELTGGGGETGDGQGPAVGGSIADGKSREWEDGKASDGEEIPGLSEAEKELVRQQVAKEVQEHQKARGNVPAGVLRWSEDYLKPSVLDWRKALQSRVQRIVSQKSGNYDYSFRKMNKKSEDFLFPGMVKPDVKVSCVVDTSGSISPKELGTILSEVEGILKKCEIQNVRVISCDCDVHSDKVVRSIKELKYEIKGGGGTDMGLAISYLEKQRTKTSCCIVFTDGYTPWPEEKPRNMEVVVCYATENYTKSAPEWAHEIFVKPSK